MRDRSLSPDSRFYSAMAALVVVAIVAGFAPTFFARGVFFEPPPLTPAVWLHGVLVVHALEQSHGSEPGARLAAHLFTNGALLGAYDLWSRRRPHSVSLCGASALVAIDITTTWWLAQAGS